MEIAGINKCEKWLKVDVSYSFSRIKVRLSIVWNIHALIIQDIVEI